MLSNTDGYIRRHVVRVVPINKLEVTDVTYVEEDADQRPASKYCSPSGSALVEPENPDGRVVQAVQHAGAGAKVVELLGDPEIASMEDRAEDPRGNADTRQPLIERKHRVGLGYLGADLFPAIPMRPQVAEREEDTEGLLHAKEAIKGPFSIELLDGETRGHALVGNYMLTGIIAFAGAIPEE